MEERLCFIPECSSCFMSRDDLGADGVLGVSCPDVSPVFSTLLSSCEATSLQQTIILDRKCAQSPDVAWTADREQQQKAVGF